MSRTLELENFEGVFIVTPLRRISDLKENNVADELQEVLAHLDNAKGRRVLVDFANVSSFGTGMMQVLVMLHNKIAQDDQPLVLCNVSNSCRDILKTARFDIFCTTYSSRQDALAALRGDSGEIDRPAYRRFTIARREKVVVLRLVDSQLSDLALHDQFRAELLRLIDEQQPSNVLVNFGAVRYCTTGVVESLLRAKKSLAAHSGQVKLCELSKLVYESFEALNLIGTVFRVYETEAEALYAFSQESDA
jgi:anti-anti-sigma regulatory factor